MEAMEANLTQRPHLSSGDAVVNKPGAEAQRLPPRASLAAGAEPLGDPGLARELHHGVPQLPSRRVERHAVTGWRKRRKGGWRRAYAVVTATGVTFDAAAKELRYTFMQFPGQAGVTKGFGVGGDGGARR